MAGSFPRSSLGKTRRAPKGYTRSRVPRYRNTEPHPLQGLAGFLRWQLSRIAHRSPPAVETPPSVPCTDDRGKVPRPRLTWIGHSTLLLELAGCALLTDPHFSRRASPCQAIGPRRRLPPAMALGDLPPLDLVLISHNHYDHLDRLTLRRLARLGPPRLTVAPPGLGGKLRHWGLTECTELGWWEEREVGSLRVRAVPVKHSSSRWGLDRNRTGWNGYLVEAEDLRFLFAGDTAYSGDFRTIRERSGRIDLAALPIGAYQPRWFMRHVHASPEEAVQIHLDLGAKRSVAMHWGTFPLTDEPMDEPPRRLRRALGERGLSADEFLVLGHGEVLAL